MQTTTQISLTPKDQQIFSFVMEVKQALQLNTTFRVAGGWVRDKLLHKDSNDIDIALDDMTGERFVHLAQQYQQSKEGDKVMGGFGVTKLNPEKSKHLETARLKIYGEWIDLVNLRAEEYTDSRVPTIRIGTPAEDAFRRDLTINALFYNINEATIEDFTNQGLQDLKDKVIRTPLEPTQTFLDDPLRILRCFRFATRFNYSIRPEIFCALGDPRVVEALSQKVSRERVGVEWKLVLLNNQPQPIATIRHYMTLMHDHGIYTSLMAMPTHANTTHQNLPQDYHHSYALLLSCLDHQDILNQISLVSLQTEQHRLVSILSAACLPFGSYPISKNKSYQGCAAGIVKDSLKYDNDLAKQVQTVVTHSHEAQSIIQKGPELYAMIAFIQQTKELWPQAIFLAMLELSRTKDKGEVVNQTRAVVAFVEQHRLESIYQMKSVLDGNGVVSTFGLTKRGPVVNQIMQKVVLYQILHQHQTPEEQLEYIRTHIDEFMA